MLNLFYGDIFIIKDKVAYLLISSGFQRRCVSGIILSQISCNLNNCLLISQFVNPIKKTFNYCFISDINTIGLLHIDSKNRFFLRGISDFWGEGNHKIYTDFLPFTEEIVSKSSDIFVMPKIPTPKTKTGKI